MAAEMREGRGEGMTRTKHELMKTRPGVRPPRPWQGRGEENEKIHMYLICITLTQLSKSIASDHVHKKEKNQDRMG